MHEQWRSDEIARLRVLLGRLESPLSCGHAAACLEGGSADPDAQVTMWCGACVELDRVRNEATAAERARLLTVIAEIEGEFGPYPLREQKELIAQFRAAIKEATNGI